VLGGKRKTSTKHNLRAQWCTEGQKHSMKEKDLQSKRRSIVNFVGVPAKGSEGKEGRSLCREGKREKA